MVTFRHDQMKLRSNAHRFEIIIYQYVRCLHWRKLFDQLGELVRRNAAILDKALKVICGGGLRALPHGVKNKRCGLDIIVQVLSNDSKPFSGRHCFVRICFEATLNTFSEFFILRLAGGRNMLQLGETQLFKGY